MRRIFKFYGFQEGLGTLSHTWYYGTELVCIGDRLTARGCELIINRIRRDNYDIIVRYQKKSVIISWNDRKISRANFREAVFTLAEIYYLRETNADKIKVS